MKVAICYSGMFRDFVECVDNHKLYLIDNYNCDIYLHLWDVYGFGMTGVKYNSTNDTQVSEDDINYILNTLKPKKYVFESISDKENELSELADSISTHNFMPFTKNVLSMYYKIKQVGNFLKESQKEYDVVVRMRTDIIFSDSIIFNTPLDANKIYGIKNWVWDEKLISDLFLYGNQTSMHKFHDLYDNLKLIWDKVGPFQSPEYLLFIYLLGENIEMVKDNIFLNLRRETIK